MYLSPDAKRNAELAARFALIAAAPADPEIRTAPSSAPKQVLAKMAEAGGRPSRSEVLGRKAGYAFDPGNVDVDISYSLLSRSPEVTATVVFQQPCGILIGRVFGTNRGDNVYVTPITAEVTLL
jgi:hypothetical protein